MAKPKAMIVKMLRERDDIIPILEAMVVVLSDSIFF
jgi:hypothetical protein